MARTFHVDIMSASSIDKLIKDLTNYQNDFNVRVRVFIRRLTRIAIEEIEKDISDAAITMDGTVESGANIEHSITEKFTDGKTYSKSTITVRGKEIMFIEFGSGVYYNSVPSPHPKGEEFGFVIGSYGKGMGLNQVWGYYDESGQLHLTHGVKATMPLYNAIQRLYKEAPIIAKEVFGG